MLTLALTVASKIMEPKELFAFKIFVVVVVVKLINSINYFESGAI